VLELASPSFVLTLLLSKVCRKFKKAIHPPSSHLGPYTCSLRRAPQAGRCSLRRRPMAAICTLAAEPRACHRSLQRVGPASSRQRGLRCCPCPGSDDPSPWPASLTFVKNLWAIWHLWGICEQFDIYILWYMQFIEIIYDFFWKIWHICFWDLQSIEIPKLHHSVQ
jgi:hypothetical protein